MRLAAFLIATAVAARGQAAASLASAAQSPYELARYINSHTGFAWEPLWKALGVSDPANSIFVCEAEQSCTTELITSLDPDQTVLLIHNGTGWDAYLRYLGTPSNGWRFSGVYAPEIWPYPTRHESTRVGQKPFLRVSSRGASGSDIGSEIENWFDLTQTRFQTRLVAFSRRSRAGSSGPRRRNRPRLSAICICQRSRSPRND